MSSRDSECAFPIYARRWGERQNRLDERTEIHNDLVKEIGSDTNVYSTSIYQDPTLRQILAQNAMMSKNRYSVLFELTVWRVDQHQSGNHTELCKCCEVN